MKKIFFIAFIALLFSCNTLMVREYVSPLDPSFFEKATCYKTEQGYVYLHKGEKIVLSEEFLTKYNQQGTHPNALSDGDNKGRGTGGNSDQLNTVNGGNDIDINGNPDYPGSGRNQLIARNESKYDTTLGPKGYGPNKTYTDYINNNNDTPTLSRL